MSGIGIIDVGMGNLTSVRNALRFIGADGEFVRRPEEAARCAKIILPGVGAFGQAMARLEETGIAQAVAEHVGAGKPLLGICLGMQLLYSSSTEYGLHAGLGLVEGTVQSLLDVAEGLPVPHIGWAMVQPRGSSVLLQGIAEDQLCFYFVHGYYCNARDKARVTGAVEYGVDMDVVVEQGNVFGCQFHPEKSQKSGLAVLGNFVRL